MTQEMKVISVVNANSYPMSNVLNAGGAYLTLKPDSSYGARTVLHVNDEEAKSFKLGDTYTITIKKKRTPNK